jgi:hypothetical protein
MSVALKKGLVTLGRLGIIIGLVVLVVSLLETLAGMRFPGQFDMSLFYTALAIVVSFFAIRRVPKLFWMLAVIAVGYLTGGLGGTAILFGAVVALIGEYL